MRKTRLTHKTVILVIGLIGCLMSIPIASKSIHAQGGCPDMFASGLWTLVQGETATYGIPKGVDAVLLDGHHWNNLYGFVDFPSAATVTNLYIDWSSGPGGNMGFDAVYAEGITSPGGSAAGGSGIGDSVTGAAHPPQEYHYFGSALTGVRRLYIQAYASDNVGADNVNRFVVLNSLSVCYTGGGTPTPTPTPIAPPAEPAGILGKTCALLGEANATFTNLPGNWSLQAGSPIIAAPHNPPGSTQGMYLFLGSATLSLNLDPSVQYSIYVVYQAGTINGLADHFTMKLGSNPDIRVPIDITTDEQTFTAPPSIYTPYYVVIQDGEKSPGLYDFTISKELNDGAIDSELVIKYVCISAINTNPDGSAAVPTALIATCSDCVYKPVGDLFRDIPQLLAWLWCGISQLWDCVAKALFSGIWKTIANILVFISFVRIWLGLIISHGADWLIGNLAVLSAWLRGNITNLITAIVNGAAYVLKNLGILDFLNNVINFILSIPAAIVSAINNLGVLLGTVGQTIGTAIGIVGYWIGRTFNLVAGVIGFIPQVIGSIIAGFNTTNTIPAWAPLCTDTNTLLYYPCLGMYILDNTIFDGPIYFLIPAAMGIMGTYTLLWTIQQIKVAMEQS